MYTVLLLVVGLVLSFLTLPIAADTRDCKKSDVPGYECTLTVYDVLPTQFSVGMEEVECKKNMFESLSNSDLEKYLKDHTVPVVIGPDGYYLGDAHHMSRALMDADIDNDKKVLYCIIQENFHDLDSGYEFWEEMTTYGLLWLYDNKGSQPMDPEFLPSDLSGMQDDVFRSLAWMVRTSGGYGKEDTYYQEFLWANYFRDNMEVSQFIVNGTNGTTTRSSKGRRDIHSDRTNKVDTKMKKITHKSKLSDPASASTTWSYCTVEPYSPQCLPNQSAWLQNALPTAMQLATDPNASTLPGYGEGVEDPPNCG